MVGIYARVSTIHQKDNYSLSVQKRKGIEFAQSIGEDYSIYEEAQSGGSMIARTELERLLNDIQNNVITKIWSIELTRLSRSVEDFQVIKRIFTDNKVELYINDIKTDLTLPDQRFIFNINAAVSEYERERIIERTRRGLTELKNQGKTHAPHLLGYDRKYDPNGNPKYVINEEEAETVRLMFAKYREGLSLGKIARYLNECRIQTKLGSKWTKTSVCNILKNIRFTGHSKNTDGEIIESKLYSPIISLTEFNDLWENFRLGLTYLNYKSIKWQSSGIIRCPICDAKWRFYGYIKKTNHKEYHYYRADHSSFCTNRRKGFPKEYIDDAIDRALFLAFIRTDEAKQLYQQRIKEKLRKSDNSRNLLERYEDEFSKLEKRKEKIIDAISNDVLTLDDAKKKLDEITQKKEELENRMNELAKECEIVDDTDEVFDLFNVHQLQQYIVSSEPEKKRLLREIIKDATILNGELTVVFNSGSEITINMDTYNEKILGRFGPAVKFYDTIRP